MVDIIVGEKVIKNASVRLESAPASLNSIKENVHDLIQDIFNECDKDNGELFKSFNPKMDYPRYTSYSRSKYCVGFLTKYLGTYVFRVFSRNDIYKKTKTTGVTVSQSDTTEVLRALQLNGKTYYFSKNLAYSMGYTNNTTAYSKWHISNLGDLILNEVIRKCDCSYLNDYIEEKQINYLQYIRLLMPALHNNKAEIVFKNKLFSSTHRINNIEKFLEPFSSKQIDFASKNDVINALPIIKQYGIYDLDILYSIELIMKKRRYSSSIYEQLQRTFKRLNFDTSDLGKKLIEFLKKISNFYLWLYEDYICALERREGVTVDDFFDKDYILRHDVIIQELNVKFSEEEAEEYSRIAKELSWIDREDNGYFIVIPKVIAEFKREGVLQHNCVYTNMYFKRVTNQESIVVFLRKEQDTPYVTIEYDYETFDVLQAYGKYNNDIDRKLYQYIVDLGKQLNYERLSQH